MKTMTEQIEEGRFQWREKLRSTVRARGSFTLKQIAEISHLSLNGLTTFEYGAAMGAEKLARLEIGLRKLGLLPKEK